MKRCRGQKPFNKHRSDSVVYGFDFTNVLPSGVTISSTSADTISTLSGTSSTALTATGETPNAAAYTNDEGETVAIGKAVRATIAGGTAGCKYQVTFVVTASNGELYGGDWEVDVE